MRNSINTVRDAYQIRTIQNNCLLVQGTPYKTIEGPHRKAGISNLTMGDYQNFTHQEIKPVVISGRIYIQQCTVHNDHVSTGSCQYPFNGKILHIPAEDQEQVIALINNIVNEA